MAAQSVIGASPVTFISEDTTTGPNAGTQYQIPLPLISYDSTQTPPVILTAWTSGTTIATSDVLLAQVLIQNMISRSLLTLSNLPAP